MLATELIACLIRLHKKRAEGYYLQPSYFQDANRAQPLEGVAQPQNNATIAAISAPLIEEVCRSHAPFGDTEITRVGSIEEVSADLQRVGLTDPHVLQET